MWDFVLYFSNLWEYLGVLNDILVFLQRLMLVSLFTLIATFDFFCLIINANICKMFDCNNLYMTINFRCLETKESGQQSRRLQRIQRVVGQCSRTATRLQTMQERAFFRRSASLAFVLHSMCKYVKAFSCFKSEASR